MRKALLTVICFAGIATSPLHWLSAQTQSRPVPFQIVTQNLPLPAAGEKYEAQLKAVGGRLPYRWSITAPLPAGLRLNATSGVISGESRSSNEFSVLVQVADSSDPPLTFSKLLVASSTAPFAVRWTVRPQVNLSNLSGAVRVSNGSKDVIDTTVIVVAVNEIGKAFALRYERLNLVPGGETPDLKFESSVPLGQYTVHVDAVGEVPAKKTIYRERRQMEGLIVESQ